MPFWRRKKPQPKPQAEPEPAEEEDLVALGIGHDDRKTYGIPVKDRIHMAIFGFPGTGKSTLMLYLMLQHLRKDEGLMVIDPHGWLANAFLTHIPPSERHRVIYIDPLTAYRYGRVVQLNFLEYRGVMDRGFTARAFLDALEKLYARFWGPRLDMILRNAVYTLMDSGTAKLSDLYYVISDESFREMKLMNVTDPMVRSFWTEDFKKMPKDASISALTKIHRLIQEKVITPMFDAEKSSVNFREAMDQGKIVVVNLPEGFLTSEITNFIGSLILAQVYTAAMSREEIPEEKRKPFYVYIDEAYRFFTSALTDMLQSLRKYKVFLTLASQDLEQYREDVRKSIPNLCSTIICFAVGESTAQKLEQFFMPEIMHYRWLMNARQYRFHVSTMFHGRRVKQYFEVVNPGRGPYNPEDVIKESLKIYGREVKPDLLIPDMETLKELEYPKNFTLPAWIIMLRLRKGKMEQKEIFQELRNLGYTDTEIHEALSILTMSGLIFHQQKEERFQEKVGGEIVQRGVTYHWYWLSPEGDKFFQQYPVGTRGGGPAHIQIMAKLLQDFWKDHYFVFVDTGREPGKKKPDMLVYPPEMTLTKRGVRLGRRWNTSKRFAVEVETDPQGHQDRLLNNWKKNTALGMPVVFAVDSMDKKTWVEAYLQQHGANPVKNILQEYKPGNFQVVVVDVESGWRESVVETLTQALVSGKPSEAKPETETVITRSLHLKIGLKIDLPENLVEAYGMKRGTIVDIDDREGKVTVEILKPGRMHVFPDGVKLTVSAGNLKQRPNQTWYLEKFEAPTEEETEEMFMETSKPAETFMEASGKIEEVKETAEAAGKPEEEMRTVEKATEKMEAERIEVEGKVAEKGKAEAECLVFRNLPRWFPPEYFGFAPYIEVKPEMPVEVRGSFSEAHMDKLVSGKILSFEKGGEGMVGKGEEPGVLLEVQTEVGRVEKPWIPLYRLRKINGTWKVLRESEVVKTGDRIVFPEEMVETYRLEEGKVLGKDGDEILIQGKTMDMKFPVFRVNARMLEPAKLEYGKIEAWKVKGKHQPINKTEIINLETPVEIKSRRILEAYKPKEVKTYGKTGNDIILEMETEEGKKWIQVNADLIKIEDGKLTIPKEDLEAATIEVGEGGKEITEEEEPPEEDEVRKIVEERKRKIELYRENYLFRRTISSKGREYEYLLVKVYAGISEGERKYKQKSICPWDEYTITALKELGIDPERIKKV